MDNRSDDNLLLFTPKFLKQRGYWGKKLSGGIMLGGAPPGDNPDPGLTRMINQKEVIFPRRLGQWLIAFGKQSDLSIYIILLAGVKSLMARYGGERDITVLSPLYKDNVTAETINKAVIIHDIVEVNMPFIQLVLDIRQSVLDAYENQDYPMDKLLEYLLEVNPAGFLEPADNIICAYKNIHDEENQAKLEGALSFVFARERDRINLCLLYDSSQYSNEYAGQITTHLVNILEGVRGNVEKNISSISLLTKEEKQCLVFHFNDNRLDFPDDKPLHRLVEQHAQQTPGRIAAAFLDLQLTYREINRQAHRLAACLQKRGIGREQPVGILLKRSHWLPLSILAVWKVGGAYIPIEPHYPARRVREILEDSGARVLISREGSEYTGIETGFKDRLILLDHLSPGELCPSFTRTDENFNMWELAYIIYTSGSTGKPRGAMVEHAGMMNHIRAKIHDLQLNAESRVAQNSSHTFDISVWQLFAPLTLGGKIVIYPDELIMEPRRLLTRLVKDRITVLEVVPSYLSILLDILHQPDGVLSIDDLDYLLVTGEEVKFQLVEKWFAAYPHIKMVNAYGPTEASDDITHYIMERVPQLQRISIGKSLHNLNIYILDQHLNLCPVGVIGEICVSGVGVGRGYLNNPQLTAEKFVKEVLGAGDRCRCTGRRRQNIYETGDLGRWLPDGNIEFLGRIDHQVKIRGFRIELGEIEFHLANHPEVKEAVVIDIQLGETDRDVDSGIQYQVDHCLCAYLVTRNPLAVSEIKAFLSRQLPNHMIPTYFVNLERLPLTSNGKINRSALPPPRTPDQDMLPYVSSEMLNHLVLESPNLLKSENPELEKFIEKQGDPEDINEEAVLTREEKNRILYCFNNTQLKYPRDKSIPGLFADQVIKTPDYCAVVSEDRQLTYSQLNQQARHLSLILRNKGIKTNSPVGLVTRRSVEMIVAMMAILKAGGAYLPINPDEPGDRIAYFIADAGLRVLVTAGGSHLPAFESRLIVIDAKEAAVNGSSEAPDLPLTIHPRDIAVGFYTSGTTGNPKGVLVEHRNITNLVFGLIETVYSRLVKKGNKVLNICMIAPYYFDASVQQIYPALLQGHALHIVPEETRLDGALLLNFFKERDINVSDGTPSHIRLILDSIKGRKTALSPEQFLIAGEVFPKKQVEALLDCISGNKYGVMNLYGPTETCVDSTYFPISPEEIDRWDTIPIGRPLPNESIYILNKKNQLQPIAVSGELCIGGDGVARGYLNRVELSAEKFVLNPFRKNDRLYKTGDIARWFPDGNIDFIGRVDHQVKMNGIRIELPEIESFLLSCKDVNDAVVLVREDKTANQSLHAYMVSDRHLSATGLRRYMADKLPLYMVPLSFVQLEKMPLTANGKVNREVLEMLEVTTAQQDGYMGAENEPQEQLVKIWSEVLHLEQSGIGIDANFFELGGNSLNIIQVNNKIKEVFQEELPVLTLFSYPTIRSLAGYLHQSNGDGNFSSKEKILQDKTLEKFEDSMKEAVQLFEGI